MPLKPREQVRRALALAIFSEHIHHRRRRHPNYLVTSDGLNLTKAFMQIRDPKLRRSIVNLVEQIADSEDQ
jgi:hypothetical protein